MIESLLVHLEGKSSMMNASNIYIALTNVVKVTEQNIFKEGVTKNAFIDSLIQILEAHKEPISPA